MAFRPRMLKVLHREVRESISGECPIICQDEVLQHLREGGFRVSAYGAKQLGRGMEDETRFVFHATREIDQNENGTYALERIEKE